MSPLVVKVRRLRPGNLPLPAYQTEHAAGMDLLADIEGELVLEPLARKLVPTGISLELPEGYEGQVRPRSGLALRHGVTCLNSPGTVDADYRGEVGVLLVNVSNERYVVKRGDRIAQLIVAPVTRVALREADALGASSRGTGGFGSTGA